MTESIEIKIEEIPKLLELAFKALVEADLEFQQAKCHYYWLKENVWRKEVNKYHIQKCKEQLDQAFKKYAEYFESYKKIKNLN